MYQEGSERIMRIKTKKEFGETIETPVTDAERPCGALVFHADVLTEDFPYARHRTISLGNYEFARIQIGVQYGLPLGTAAAEQEAALESARAFVREFLAREEAHVRRAPREVQALPVLPGIKRVVWVEYGLTLSSKVKMEGYKVDMGWRRPIADGADAAAAVTQLQDAMGNRIEEERNAIRGEDGVAKGAA